MPTLLMITGNVIDDVWRSIEGLTPRKTSWTQRLKNETKKLGETYSRPNIVTASAVIMSILLKVSLGVVNHVLLGRRQVYGYVSCTIVQL